MRKIEILDRERAEAGRWVDEVAKHLDPDRDAPAALRAVLQTVRDCLQFDEAVHLGNHLPAILRGLYFDGWDPTPPPVGGLTREIFLSLVSEKLPGADDKAVDAVLGAARILLQGKLKHLTRNWPEFLKQQLLEPAVTKAEPVDAPKPADLPKAGEKMEAAIERGEIDGFPEVSYQIVLDEAKKEPSPFEGVVRETVEWIEPLLSEPGMSDPDTAFEAVRVALQVLRDRLSRDEALQIGLQLPTVLRGFYLENWKPDLAPADKDLRKEVVQRFDKADPDQALAATSDLLSRRLSSSRNRGARRSRARRK